MSGNHDGDIRVTSATRIRAWVHGGVSFSRKISNNSNDSMRKRRSIRGKAFIRAQREEKFGTNLTISMRISVGRWSRRESVEEATANTGNCFRLSAWSTEPQSKFPDDFILCDGIKKKDGMRGEEKDRATTRCL